MPYTGASPITLQVGANYGQVLTITPVDASSGGLGLGGVDLTASAATAIRTVDNAIAALSSMRANFGAVGNRLEHGIANLQNTQENLASAESRLRDADMADETMQLTRQQILAESSQSMLAQANLKPQLLLPLLTG
jgi:flagellin